MYMSGHKRINTIIVGAAGRDFHNFNMVYRDNDQYNVVAFTAAQIPNIAGRKYPASLAGALYPKGIPIYEEKDLEQLIVTHSVDEVVFSYSDVPYRRVMSIGSRAIAAGAHFKLLSARETMIESSKPVISVCAVRTGSGKSQTCRKVAKLLHEFGFRVAAIRHPMPYGDLEKQKVQRFAAVADLKKHKCTIEEMEEYEPHIVSGTIIYAGVDYEAILRQAENDADIIIWDGGNNDLPFYKPDVHIVVADPLRAGDELTYYPSEANLRMADVVIINKIDSATPEAVIKLRENIRSVNTKAKIVDAASPIMLERSDMVAGKKSARDRRRTDVNSRRDENRSRNRCSSKIRRRGNYRSAPVCNGRNQKNVSDVSQNRHVAAGNGLQRPANTGPRSNDQQSSVRCRYYRDADRPETHCENKKTGASCYIRTGRNRRAEPSDNFE